MILLTFCILDFMQSAHKKCTEIVKKNLFYRSGYTVSIIIDKYR